MLQRKGLVRAAAFAALACSGICRAETGTASSSDALALRPQYFDATTAPAPAPATAPAPTPAPLMYFLEHTPFGKPLEDAGFKIGGFVEGGYTASFQHPVATDNNIVGRFQDTKSEHVVLDQIDFAIDRSIDYSTGKFDVGGHFEFIYGRDTAFFHSSRIYDTPNTFGDPTGTYYHSATSPENQADIVQAYLDFAVPVGSGLRVRVGKFVTLLGYELINSTSNPLYSHSFLFTYAIPLTQTGVLTEYKVSPEIQIDAGITRGWSQSLRDNNGDPDFLGGITYTPQKSDFWKKFTFIANLSEGPQATGNNSDWWSVIDLQMIYTDGPWKAVINADYGDAPGALATGAAQWGGVAAYLSYTPPNQSFYVINTRLEWYDDAQGFTAAGYATPSGGTPSGTLNLYEATIGAAITPFPDDYVLKNLVVRPEFRFDYAGKDFFNGDTKHFQSTFGIDVYFTY